MKKFILGVIFLGIGFITVAVNLVYLRPSVTRETFKIDLTNNSPITLEVSEPANPISIEATIDSKNAQSIPPAYLKSSVHNCTTYEEWRSHVSADYANALSISESNFNEKKGTAKKIHKKGVILYWVTAENHGMEMMYLIERVKYTPDLPEAVAIRHFIRVNGAWLAHTRDELNLTGAIHISDLGLLKKKLSEKNE